MASQGDEGGSRIVDSETEMLVLSQIDLAEQQLWHLRELDSDAKVNLVHDVVGYIEQNETSDAIIAKGVTFLTHYATRRLIDGDRRAVEEANNAIREYAAKHPVARSIVIKELCTCLDEPEGRDEYSRVARLEWHENWIKLLREVAVPPNVPGRTPMDREDFNLVVETLGRYTIRFVIASEGKFNMDGKGVPKEAFALAKSALAVFTATSGVSAYEDLNSGSGDSGSDARILDRHRKALQDLYTDEHPNK